jgi:hypothetical protein
MIGWLIISAPSLTLAEAVKDGFLPTAAQKCQFENCPTTKRPRELSRPEKVSVGIENKSLRSPSVRGWA